MSSSGGGSFGMLNLLGHNSEHSKAAPPVVSQHLQSSVFSAGHSHHHHQTGSAIVTRTGSNDTSTSSNSGHGGTTLELHPNVILGMGDDNDEDEEQEAGEPNRPHLCSVCHASYKTRTHLRRHMFIHMSNRPFPCQDCGKGFNRREHLNKHMEAVHSGSKHNCPYCRKEISRMDHLKRHIKNMHTDKEPKSAPHDKHKGAILKFEMGCGQKQKAQISFLSPHFPSGTIGQTVITPIPLGGSSIHDGGSGMLKPKCESNSPDSSRQMTSGGGSSSSGMEDSPPSMTIIPSNILGPGQGIATLSIQSTPTQKVLIHQRLPSGCGTDLNMTTATNGLASLANLNLSLGGHSHSDHQDKKMMLPIYNCGHCSSTFTTEKDLAQHSRSHKPQPHRCPECPRAYTRREKLTEHIRCVHQGQKFGCDYCGKKLSRKDHVLRHIRSVHPEAYASTFAEMDDGYLILDEHGKLVSTRNSLPLVSPSRKRKTPVDGERVGIPAIGDVGVLLRSVCHVCLKVFGTAYHLTRHVESCHSGDVRPFSCDACNKQFKRKDHLTKHVKSHCPSLKETLQTSKLETADEKASTPAPHPPSTKKIKAESLPQQRKSEERNDPGKIAKVHVSASDNESHHHAVLHNLQVEMNTNRHGHVEGHHHQQHHVIHPGGHGIGGSTSLLVDSSQHKHSDHGEYSLAVIDSFMQGNVNVVVVDEDISNYLQQSSGSHLTTTFPCGQCQKEFHARDHLIAHLQEHTSDSSVLPSGQHIADISFTDF